ncbi:MAG: TonB-dependent receptor [Candidatus Edwardsbacteria bacterium]
MFKISKAVALFLIIGGLVWCWASFVSAGTTGKIVGRVTDAQTGEALPGANVVIVGTQMGAATNLDGYYVIINIPVGTYSVKASMMGYDPMVFTEVRVVMDLTTTQNFKLNPAVIEMKVVEVKAERPMVIKDGTSTTRVVTTKEIAALPAASALNVVSNTAGAVGSGAFIHVRGGREDEISYFVDGLSVQDPLVGGIGLQVNTQAIEEVMVITGGFNAEYGEAMSGVVNIVTKEGGEKFSGLGRYTTDEFLGSRSRHYNRFELNFGGPVPLMKNLTYFLSSEITNTQSADAEARFITNNEMWVRDPSSKWFWADTLQFSESTYQADTTEDTLGLKHWSGSWGDSSAEAWNREKEWRIQNGWKDGWKKEKTYYLPHTDGNSYRFQGKLAFKIPALNAKVTLGGLLSRDQRARYSAIWKYALENTRAGMTKGAQYTLNWRHQIGKLTFYVLNINHFETRSQIGVRDPAEEKTRKWWEDYTFISDEDKTTLLNKYGDTAPQPDSIYDGYAGRAQDNSVDDNPYGVRGIFFGGRGLYRVWHKRKAEYNGVKFDLTSQVTRTHQVQGGVEGKFHHVYLKQNSLPWDPVPFKDYYDKYPATGAAYLQDKMEFEGLIVNAGLRLDYLNPAARKKVDYFNLTDTASTIKSLPKYRLSPRLGVSHPISDRTVLHFSYGQFFQTPELRYLYESLGANLARGNVIMGNPDLLAQKTIAYEAGFSHQFTSDIAGDVTLYYKDIFDLIGTRRQISLQTGREYTAYLNSDYGNAKGFEVTVQKRAGGIFSGKISYSLSFAKGTSSSAWEAYIRYIYGGGVDPATGTFIPLPKTDYYLEFDQRHTISASTNFELPEKFGPTLLGVKPLASLSINFQNNIGSGLPYTKENARGEQVGNVNEGRMPWTWNTDLLVTKDLKLFGLGFSTQLEILNLLNRKNVENVYAVTGDPLDDGRLILPSMFTSTIADSITLYNEITDKIDYNGDGDKADTIKMINSYYNKLRDLDGDGQVTPEDEAYKTYVAAYRDYISDPINSGRVPGTVSYGAYAGPRRIRLMLSFNF